jgi:hypothetical protein
MDKARKFSGAHQGRTSRFLVILGIFSHFWYQERPILLVFGSFFVQKQVFLHVF